MIKKSRRTFLKTSAMGITAAATADASFALSRFVTPPPSGDIFVKITAGTQRYADSPVLAWRAGGAAGESVVKIDAAKKYQQVLGFGAAFTDAACYMFHQLAEPARAQLLHELFHPSEMALNVCRTCIGASDYSTEVFNYDDQKDDMDLQHFSVQHDEGYVLPSLQQARKENPDLFLFSSPWSPPGWMKAGGSMLGGSMRQHYYAPYAQYLLKFLQAYSAAGAPVQAITVQNETDTDQDGKMPACLWPQEYEIGFVKNHLGPLFEKNGIQTKIWILDHNYNLWGRAICELDDLDLRKYCDAVAFHGYVGTPDMMSKVHDAHPEAHLYWTEGGPDITAKDYATDWASWGHTFTGALRNWCEALTGWNLALDEKGKPNIGPFPCGGLVTIHSQTKEITRSGQYWAFAHFSRTVKRGARRIDSSSATNAVEHVAFENTDGEKAVVVTNRGPEKKISLQFNGKTADFTAPADSIATLSWS